MALVNVEDKLRLSLTHGLYFYSCRDTLSQIVNPATRNALPKNHLRQTISLPLRKLRVFILICRECVVIGEIMAF
jgi:hypothetical protein